MIRKLFSKKQSNSRPLSTCVRPTAEMLEDRSVPAVVVSTLPNGFLSVSGDNTTDNIRIEDTDNNTIRITDVETGQVVFERPSHTVDTIQVATYGGSDFIDARLLESARLIAYAGDGNDYILGSRSTDSLFGQAGNDVIYGYNGNDYIDGGDGADYLYGFNGNDRIYGRDGNDVIFGGAGDDFLNGGNGNDFMAGGIGNDYLFGGFGNDLIYGNDGRDTLIAGFGTDHLFGGAGFDELQGQTGDFLDGGADQEFTVTFNTNINGDDPDQ